MSFTLQYMVFAELSDQGDVKLHVLGDCPDALVQRLEELEVVPQLSMQLSPSPSVKLLFSVTMEPDFAYCGETETDDRYGILLWDIESVACSASHPAVESHTYRYTVPDISKGPVVIEQYFGLDAEDESVQNGFEQTDDLHTEKLVGSPSESVQLAVKLTTSPSETDDGII